MSRSFHSIGLEVGPEAIRAVGLSRKGKVVAAEERTIGEKSYTEDVVLETLNALGGTGPIHLVQLAANARLIHLGLPTMSRRELETATEFQLAEELEQSLERFLLEQRTSRPAGGGHDITALAIPRDPLEPLAALLEQEGHELVGGTVPSAITLAESSEIEMAAGEGLLWCYLGGSRTILSLVRDGELLLSREIPLRADLDLSDEMAQFEQQLAIFNEIERSALYYQQNYDRNGVRRIVLRGAESEIESFRAQFKDPLKERGIPVTALGIRSLGQKEMGSDSDPMLGRFGLAVRAAIAPKSTLRVRPEIVVHRQKRQRRQALSALAAGIFTLAMLGWTLVEGITFINVKRDLVEAEDQLQNWASLGTPVEAPRRQSWNVLPPPAISWNALLLEMGRAAPEGVDLEQLTLDRQASFTSLRLTGRIDSDLPGESDRLSELLERLRTSPFVAGLPRLDARRDSEALRFVIELPVSPEMEVAP